MKYLKNLVAVAVLSIFMIGSTFACDFSLDVTKGEKKTYSTGNVVTVLASLELSHDPCNHELENIRLVPTGAKILSEGKWKQQEDEDGDIEYTKTIKLKITAKANKSSSLQIVRNCNRGGDSEKITFKVK